MNICLYKSIPSHLHDQFHISQFSNLPYHLPYNNNIINNNNNNNNNNDNNNNNNNNNYFELVEENFKNILKMESHLLKFLSRENKIWQAVCENPNLNVVQFIFSLKGIKEEILNNDKELNIFLIACELNLNIKIIKFIHKNFPSFINSKKKNDWVNKNSANIIIGDSNLEISDKLNILHYLYLKGINIHYISKYQDIDRRNRINYKSIYAECFSNRNSCNEIIIRYLKVISQDFDYQNNEHDDVVYKKPSFWKEIIIIIIIINN